MSKEEVERGQCEEPGEKAMAQGRPRVTFSLRLGFRREPDGHTIDGLKRIGNEALQNDQRTTCTRRLLDLIYFGIPSCGDFVLNLEKFSIISTLLYAVIDREQETCIM